MCMRCARLAGILPPPQKRGIKPGRMRVTRHFENTYVAVAPPVVPREPRFRTVGGVDFEVVFDGTWRD